MLKRDPMTKKLPKRGLPPRHPGELLREEILPALNRSKTEIARLLGVSRQTLYDILDEKQPVTPGMPCGSGSCAGMVPTCGSICRSVTICTEPSRNSERRSRRSPRWKWLRAERGGGKRPPHFLPRCSKFSLAECRERR
ncbi:MAG TPA: hypothetical protein VID30_05945 [Bradyrhizobium sp.]